MELCLVCLSFCDWRTTVIENYINSYTIKIITKVKSLFFCDKMARTHWGQPVPRRKEPSSPFWISTAKERGRGWLHPIDCRRMKLCVKIKYKYLSIIINRYFGPQWQCCNYISLALDVTVYIYSFTLLASYLNVEDRTRLVKKKPWPLLKIIWCVDPLLGNWWQTHFHRDGFLETNLLWNTFPGMRKWKMFPQK